MKTHPDEALTEVLRMIEPGRPGGYILSPSHALESDVPMENILALLEVSQAQVT